MTARRGCQASQSALATPAAAAGVVRPLGDDNRADAAWARAGTRRSDAQNLVVVGGSHVGADLAARNPGVDAATMMPTVGRFAQHRHAPLTVGVKPGRTREACMSSDQPETPNHSLHRQNSLRRWAELHLDVLITGQPMRCMRPPNRGNKKTVCGAVERVTLSGPMSTPDGGR